MELGSVATPFSRAGGTIQGELAACQRYYILYGNGTSRANIVNGWSTGTTNSIFAFQNQMRVVPTSVDFSTLMVTDQNSYDLTVTAITVGGTSNSFTASVTTSGTASQYRACSLAQRNSTTAYVGFSAEL
jgi:hypothetical protein